MAVISGKNKKKNINKNKSKNKKKERKKEQNRSCPHLNIDNRLISVVDAWGVGVVVSWPQYGCG